MFDSHSIKLVLLLGSFFKMRKLMYKTNVTKVMKLGSGVVRI